MSIVRILEKTDCIVTAPHCMRYHVRRMYQVEYRKTSKIRGTKIQNLNASRLGLQLSSHNILKPSVQWRMNTSE